MFAMFNDQLFWYNFGVKLILPLLLLVCAPLAGLALPPVSLSLPPVAFADTETTTNALLVAWRDEVREFTFSLDCLGGPEDNVQISFGTDSNTNGMLDLAECELMVGWDSGSWFGGQGTGMAKYMCSPTISSGLNWIQTVRLV